MPGEVRTIIRLRVVWELDPDVERFHLATMCGTLYTQISTLTGLPWLEGVEIHAKHPRPELPDWAYDVGVRLAFDQPEYETVVPTSLLRLAPPLAEPRAHASLRRQCRDLLALRPDPRAHGSSLRTMLERLAPAFPTLEQAARELGMTSRTLRRRLADEGASFRALRNEARLALADRWLAGSSRSITEIALELGYSDAANFSRAYRRARGRSPQAARRALALGEC